MKELDLSYNQLTTLPGSIGEFKSLTWLYLNNNNLTTLSDRIGDLKSLKELQLRKNQLTTLPDKIGDLKSLKELNLGWNKLSTLPDGIGDLKSLKNLSLSSNKLTTLPDRIEDLKSLKELELGWNKLTKAKVSKLTKFAESANVTLDIRYQSPSLSAPEEAVENESETEIKDISKIQSVAETVEEGKTVDGAKTSFNMMNRINRLLGINKPQPQNKTSDNDIAASELSTITNSLSPQNKETSTSQPSQNSNSKMSPAELEQHNAEEKESAQTIQDNIARLQTEEFVRMAELLKEIPKLKESVSNASSTSEISARVKASEAELARISKKYKSSPEDVAERSHISSNNDLTDYYQRAEKSFNEAFTAAAMLSSDEFKQRASYTAQTMETISKIVAPLPFVSVILYEASEITDAVLTSRRLGQFNNISDLNPTSNPVEGAIFSEKLARRLTITNEDEITTIAQGGQNQLKGIRGFINQAQEGVMASAKKQLGKLDDATSRGLFGEDLSSTQLLALNNSKAALDHVMQQNHAQISQTKSEIRSGKQEEVIDRVVENAIGKSSVRLDSLNATKRSGTINSSSVSYPLSPNVSQISSISSQSSQDVLSMINNMREDFNKETQALKEQIKSQAKEIQTLKHNQPQSQALNDVKPPVTGGGQVLIQSQKNVNEQSNGNANTNVSNNAFQTVQRDLAKVEDRLSGLVTNNIQSNEERIDGLERTILGSSSNNQKSPASSVSEAKISDKDKDKNNGCCVVS